MSTYSVAKRRLKMAPSDVPDVEPSRPLCTVCLIIVQQKERRKTRQRRKGKEKEKGQQRRDKVAKSIHVTREIFTFNTAKELKRHDCVSKEEEWEEDTEAEHAVDAGDHDASVPERLSKSGNDHSISARETCSRSRR